jgi:hypothetical protein
MGLGESDLFIEGFGLNEHFHNDREDSTGVSFQGVCFDLLYV